MANGFTRSRVQSRATWVPDGEVAGSLPEIIRLELADETSLVVGSAPQLTFFDLLAQTG
jgi:hypothetical protein